MQRRRWRRRSKQFTALHKNVNVAGFKRGCLYLPPPVSQQPPRRCRLESVIEWLRDFKRPLEGPSSCIQSRWLCAASHSLMCTCVFVCVCVCADRRLQWWQGHESWEGASANKLHLASPLPVRPLACATSSKQPLVWMLSATFKRRRGSAKEEDRIPGQRSGEKALSLTMTMPPDCSTVHMLMMGAMPMVVPWK